MTPVRMARYDFVSALVLIVFGLVVLVESLRMDRLENLNVNPYTVPGLVPGILGGLLMLCGLLLLVRSILRGGWRLGLSQSAIVDFLKDEAVKRTSLTLLLTFGFALGLFGTLPFGIAAALFIFSFILILRDRELADKQAKVRYFVFALCVAVAAGYGIEIIFTHFFFVKLN